MTAPRTKIDRKILRLVDVLNQLGMGETVSSCDGHDRVSALVFAGYERAPLLPHGVLPIVRKGVAMRNPAYVDIKPDPAWRGELALLMAYLVHNLDERLYGNESEAVRVEFRPGDKLQILFPHEWDPRHGVLRSVHDLEMRVEFVMELCLSFDPRAEWTPGIRREIDFYTNLEFLSRFAPTKDYPALK